MGVVWAADDLLLRRQVAIKEVHPDHEDRMRHEAQIGARVCHPNVVTVYDLVYEDGKPWLVMRLVRSRSLAAVLTDDGPMLPSQAAAMGRQVLAGLEAVHAQGVVHCDVKPGNVLLDERNDAHLTDFGIAADTGSRMVGTLFGAPSYIAPERARGLPMEAASDLWSLGATLYAAVEGRPPVDRGDPLSTVTAIVAERPRSPAHAGGLRSVIDGLLSPDPADRPDPVELQRLLLQVTDSGVESTQARPKPRVAPADTSRSIPVPAPSPPRHRAQGVGSASTSVPRHSSATPTPRDNATTAIPLGRPPLMHRTPLVLLGLTAGIAAGLFWFGGQVPLTPPSDSPAVSTSQAPAANPEMAAVVPSEVAAVKPVAQAPAQAPARAPEAFSGPTSEPEPTTAVVSSEAPPPVTSTSEVPTTTEQPSTPPETPEATVTPEPSVPEASTPPPSGPSEVEPLG